MLRQMFPTNGHTNAVGMYSGGMMIVTVKSASTGKAKALFSPNHPERSKTSTPPGA